MNAFHDRCQVLFGERLGYGRRWKSMAASLLGIGRASLYRYFASKGELLAAARAAAHDRFSDRIEAAYASADDPWQRSRAIGHLV